MGDIIDMDKIQSIAYNILYQIAPLNWANWLSIFLSLSAIIIASQVASKQNRLPLSMEPARKNNRYKRIRESIFPYLYYILYGIILFLLWLYIGLNWEKCISMQFFSQFDGNNILFLVGIVLTMRIKS